MCWLGTFGDGNSPLPLAPLLPAAGKARPCPKEASGSWPHHGGTGRPPPCTHMECKGSRLLGFPGYSELLGAHKQGHPVVPEREVTQSQTRRERACPDLEGEGRFWS